MLPLFSLLFAPLATATEPVDLASVFNARARGISEEALQRRIEASKPAPQPDATDVTCLLVAGFSPGFVRFLTADAHPDRETELKVAQLTEVPATCIDRYGSAVFRKAAWPGPDCHAFAKEDATRTAAAVEAWMTEAMRAGRRNFVTLSGTETPVVCGW